MIVDVPEPFLGALTRGEPGTACDAEAPTAAALFGRGTCRALVGRDRDARSDFEAALPELGDACRVELAFLGLRERSAVREALRTAREVIDRTDPGSTLAARAWHVAGLAQGKLRRTGPAIDALAAALDLYRAHGDRAGAARVHDSLGMVHAARGRLDHGVHHYAMSLVEKSLARDRPGVAITLGNLGRLHLRAGRYGEARDCFELDLRLSRELGDTRGQGRMLDDLGRLHLAEGDLRRAEARLRECLRWAEDHGFPDLEFFAAKDLALVLSAAGRLAEAGQLLERARSSLPKGGEPYLELLLRAARGEWLLARGDDEALEELEAAVRGFGAADLPDLEISARVALARALAGRRLKASAERCLLAGLRRARGAGYERYVPALNEAMSELDLVEGALDETDRVGVEGPGAPDGAYLLRERLGGGAFGEVFRAHDPDRAREVAFKRIRLARLYDAARRERLLASMRHELEAASRVRHPGVARVFAIGRESGGDAYVVQELVRGRSLRELMPEDSGADLAVVLGMAARVAHALHALHEVGVVHRDLKPENVLVRDDGSPVLVDFGIAHLGGRKDGALGDHAVVGTLEYMAPEQALGRAVDRRADLHALGVLLYEWLTGVRPLRPRGATVEEKLEDVATRAPAPITDFRPSLPDGVVELVGRLLEKNRRRRPATALAVAELLDRLAVEATG